ncbi:unnamed protein product, partial [Allacma fusca]
SNSRSLLTSDSFPLCTHTALQFLGCCKGCIQNQITQRPDRIPELLREAEVQNFGGSVTRIEPCEESSAAIDIGISPRSSAAPRISAA